MMRSIRFMVVMAVAACGSVTGTKAPDAKTIDATVTLDSIAVTPAAPAVAWPMTEQLMATAMYSDGTTKDVTAMATWSSGTPTIATITPAGLVSAVTAGITMISVTFDSQTGQTALTVTIPTLAVSGYTSKGVDFFPANVTGNVAPTRSIRGAATTFVAPRGLAIVGQELFVIDQGFAAVDVFPLDGSGNIAPTRQIVGAATTLASTAPSQIFAFNNEIYVTHQNGTVVVFPSTANGNVAPSRVITSTAPAIASTIGVTVFNNELYIGDYSGSLIAVFPVTANGTVTPTRTITGAATGLSGPQGIAVFNNELYVSNGGGNTITVYPVAATGNAAPTRTISGAATMLSYPDELYISGTLVYSADYSNNTVEVFQTTDTGNVAPTMSIGGAATLLSGDLGLIVF